MAHINISGDYVITQSNATKVNVHMEQDGPRLSGFAKFRNVTSTNLEGTANGESVDFTINWSDGHTGRYWGRLVEPFSHRDWEGVLRGSSEEQCHGHQRANWEVEDRVFQRLVPH
ncbi:hypothetical protein OG361_37675 [Streptomyces sp. NBC_00090]|uniref:hypothetical protein n=1 Tax=Streptomyces sp. NBC_00090 TaxID=2903619 RepID=UPI00324CD21E